MPPIVQEVLRSAGQPLDAETRAFMEPRLGHDFGRVQVHADGRAAESARQVRARAYTVGAHLVFNESEYQPRTHAGKSLIAHELTHVLQQAPATRSPAGQLRIDESPAREREAEQVSRQVNGDLTRPPAGTPHSDVHLSRQAEVAAEQGGGLCFCSFSGSHGELRVDCGCGGTLGLWVIDEGSAPAAGATCGSWIDADGFVLGGTTYKIDGSTCAQIACDGGSPRISACVNLIAGLLGKRPPYPVPAGTFGGTPKEPVPGATPPLVT